MQSVVVRTTVALAVLTIFTVPASAAPILWTLSGAFNDGGTASGSFVYDADLNLYSDVDVTTTAGSARSGSTYSFVSPGIAPSNTQVLFNTVGGGDLTGTPNVPWQYAKGTAYVPSPILYGDYLYLTTDRGILTAIDAKTGEVKYEGGRIPIPATFTASPVAFEGKILMTSEDGDTFMVKAGPKHEILGTNSIGEAVYASPAIADGRIFIRGEKNLYCIGS